MARSSLFLVSICFVACGARTDLGGYADVASLTDLQGVVVNTCGPVRQGALAFMLVQSGETVPSCTSTTVGAVNVLIWGPNMPQTPGTYALGDGSATYCSPQEQCVTADHGTLTLTALDEMSATGSFSLVMPDHTTVTGNFTAIQRCYPVVDCR